MGEIIYKSLSSLSPIELKYQYFKDEELEATVSTYRDGFSFFNIDGLKGFQDVAINRESCLVLTSAVNLNTVFTSDESLDFKTSPASIYIQPRNSTIYFLKHEPVTNTFQNSLTSGSTFYVTPVNETDVEMLVDSKYVQVTENYPYNIFLSDKSLDPESINRQRFNIVYQEGQIVFKTLTQEGYRFLAVNTDGVLRATGTVLNNSVVTDYIFKYIPITEANLEYGFQPSNDWVTYYFDVESQADNKTVTINKNIENVVTNLLIDFPIEKAAETGTATINIANLKTGVTPSGGPAPINNAYTKSVITSN